VSGNGRLATVFPGVAAVVLGEAMTLVAIGGGVVILLGVWLVNRRAFT
jgi:drug/metabolite transporter (DMT)-like permease